MSKKLNVLVACEESQAVCIAFRELGHEAWSCDLQECSGGHPEWHINCDVLKILRGGCEFMTQDGLMHLAPDKWDLVIAHPPCTDLAVSGAAWFAEKQHDMRQQKAVVFFMHCVYANSYHTVVENPVCIMSTCYKKPTQIIHPWMFGDNYSKQTCLWIEGLPKLKQMVTERPELEWFEWTDKKTGKKKRQPKWFADAWKLPPAERAKVRSKTFPGIAKAMAEQWSAAILAEETP